MPRKKTIDGKNAQCCLREEFLRLEALLAEKTREYRENRRYRIFLSSISLNLEAVQVLRNGKPGKPFSCLVNELEEEIDFLSDLLQRLVFIRIAMEREKYDIAASLMRAWPKRRFGGKPKKLRFLFAPPGGKSHKARRIPENKITVIHSG